ncbi:polysaccharide biosynthesis/export family protein [Pontibacter sp. BT310]|uniref:Polysaccharide biosynthesis/export family protein n=1 Tax=Pontibacter populi TaxID=890055 RepID=A0ABS6XC71_9BACT|nr:MULTISPECIES: polysaccharide biosynthesis/export family protein [Pontibacter]MBJ6118235.1 polysaccharide biosynthesis/export family protein [Pontibacter sp. BT310]MBR0570662.1 polysaccharide biosynthesis/export family protein [Microvirga sp. STS03]MBW3365088.1 polysaccharide biosynthesis/export family protein [Pontibacter populi]
MRLHLYFYIFFFGCLLFQTSCASRQNATYFNNTTKSEYTQQEQNLEPIIQKNDLLSISVYSLNPEATEIFNESNANIGRSSTATSNISQSVGYLVDQEGNIQFPLLGRVKAAGLSKKELRDHIRTELLRRKLLIEPSVDIRYLNYKVSVLGEVARPSVLTIPNEKITLLEALGLAGDLTIYANRENLLLIREEEGKKKLTRINLTTDELFTSPNYYLKSNDIIYVEPNKTKIQSVSPARQWLPVVFSGLSIVVIAIDRLTR